MKVHKQNMAIAKAVGWTEIKMAVRGAGAPERRPSPHGNPPGRSWTCQIPNYRNCLNAMHEAAKFLASKGWRCVANMGTDGTWECFFTKNNTHLTVPGIADHYGTADSLSGAMSEAFLRTLNLWEEE